MDHTIVKRNGIRTHRTLKIQGEGQKYKMLTKTHFLADTHVSKSSQTRIYTLELHVLTTF